MASVLASMDIGRAHDAAGREIIPTPSFNDGIVRSARFLVTFGHFNADNM